MKVKSELFRIGKLTINLRIETISEDKLHKINMNFNNMRISTSNFTTLWRFTISQPNKLGEQFMTFISVLSSVNTVLRIKSYQMIHTKLNSRDLNWTPGPLDDDRCQTDHYWCSHPGVTAIVNRPYGTNMHLFLVWKSNTVIFTMFHGVKVPQNWISMLPEFKIFLLRLCRVCFTGYRIWMLVWILPDTYSLEVTIYV